MPRDLEFVPPDNLLEHFRSFGRGLAVTRGVYELRNRHQAQDLAWNHMDQMHRPLVHNTYLEASRIARGRNFALSLTKMTPFSLLVPVMDVQLGPDLFYQSFTLFSLVHVLCLNRMVPEPDGRCLQRTEWYITSHWLFKFLHPLVHRRFRRLVEFQNAQDIPIRDRRQQLRERGYRFGSDDPDYLSSNSLELAVRPPRLEGTHRIDVSAVGAALEQKMAGPIELLIRRSGGTVEVWPGVCPHEGGPLLCGKLEAGRIECPWHGLNFSGVSLTPSKPDGRLGELALTLEGESLRVQAASSAG